MDASDITKVASRRRINTEVENLRQKVSQEVAKIIKLRVGQDTSYWELKEKLGEVEREHARLQQNMVDMQMQHETLSSQYQDELRLRPEMLNKVASTREICEVLEEYMGRVRGTLERCAEDQAALGGAYAAATASVGAARQHLEHRVLALAQEARADMDRLKSRAECSERVADAAEAARRHSEEAAAAARAHLADLGAESERLRDHREALAEQLAQQQQRVLQKEQIIGELQEEVRRVAVELSVQSERVKTTLADLERESGCVGAARAALAEAEARGAAAQAEAARLRAELAEVAARGEATARDCARAQTGLVELEARLEVQAREAVALRDNLAAARCERDEARAAGDDLKLHWQDAIAMANDLKEALESEQKINKSMLDEINEKSQSIASLESTVQELEREIATRADEEKRAESVLCDVTAERDAARGDAERLSALVQERGAELDATKHQLEELRCAHAAAAREAETERAERAETIAALMRDVAQETEARARCEAALGGARADLDAARAHRLRVEEEVRRLEVAVQEKEKEAADQMKIILEMRNEKDRLHEKIRSMQGTIDNIQKELVRDPARKNAAAKQDPPELDDNAMPEPPHKEVVSKTKPSMLSVQSSQACNIDPMFFNFFSDSSAENDKTLDSMEVTRRFEALSRTIPRHSTLKADNSGRPSASKAAATSSDAPLSLSQLRDTMARAARGRTFFKNKRPEPTASKFKKHK